MIAILFTGESGSGKDTSADYLYNQIMINTEYNVRRDAFANELKEAVHKFMYNIFYDPPSEDQKDTIIYGIDYEIHYRKLYQVFGTIMRDIDKDIWIKPVVDRCIELNTDVLILSDVRYDAESEALQKIFQKVIVIRLEGRCIEGIPDHSSKYGIKGSQTLDNSGTLDELYKSLDNLMKEVLHT
jgi:hypothetical protein